MTISHDGRIITIEKDGASAEIYFYGAHVVSWKSPGQNGAPVEERFFMSDKAILDGTGPIRGGIPIAFPIFATDVHPDYPNLGGPHGFARINPWELVHQSETSDSVSIILSLSPNEDIRKLFRPDFKLSYKLTLTKFTLDAALTIVNPGKESFRFNTCLHTYFKVPEIAKASIEPLGEIPYTSRLDNSFTPGSPSTPDVIQLEDKEIARCYHLDLKEEKTSTVRVDYGHTGDRQGEGVQIDVQGDWTDSVLWNPSTKIEIPDLHKGGSLRFICWEPGVIQSLITLGPGESWNGNTLMKAL
ncbi:Uncharacterized enzymes related to aldose 1-epimerase [Phaffia rhodozyma]|uniref:Glucose-6-phosphate 1-epimerase n=1 Tax=Phaffia rhodozyma TaxID=264483 RepID=A0A0F7SN03_PHARH|nr:Uncharacterized enzymes related to aldose 1-epimerase [Phaffia rhodozyma]